MSCHTHAQGEGRCGRMNWKPMEVLAMVIGFIWWAPIGLAILFWKIWQAKSRYKGDFGEFAQEKWGEFEQRAGLRGMARNFRDWPGSSGNAAFDDWRKAELERLAEERRKIFEAEKAFEDYLEGLRHAKDREDFERFMAGRGKPEQPQS
ncbi:DUF2852 domain-containing protein [Rhodoblastus acidophilus]|uniref:DUF2852 domain-containing protein n=1 Tax=Rhodoblastus acidophilus TaxID=1074 RepID=A0A6N8DUD9_RHOAC|nr:DUF2852 domain-containing protein [Rhodoblastus acidophilus]MCW2276034.1 hypothetical protein [Rhodoblastus acidophilus]MTV32771.1 DUF2852 domain-containing protein [Rhodoblastus acidophilus]